MRSLSLSLSLVFALASSVVSSVRAEQAVPAFESRYSLSVFGTKIGESVRRLVSQGDGRWHFEAESKTVGVAALLRNDRIHESSIWRWQDGHIVPQRYTYRHEGSRKNRDIDIRFDWNTHLALSNYHGETREIPLPDGVLDHSVYQVQLMHDLARRQRPESITYTVIDGKKTKPYKIDFVGEELLDTVVGKLKTLKFARMDDDRRKSVLWLAPALAYLPVRGEHTEPRGETVTMALEALSGIQTTLAEQEK